MTPRARTGRRSHVDMNRFTIRAGSVVSRPTLVRAGALAATAALATSLAACGGGSSSAGGSGSTSTVTIGENADAAPNGYDPLLYSAGQFNFFAGLYDALFVTDAQ